METSLRYSGEDRHLQLYAKERFLLDDSVYLQVHGKLDTHTGEAGGIVRLRKRFFPEFLSSIDVGATFNSRKRDLTYDVLGKRTIPVTKSGLVNLELKSGYQFNPRSKLGNPRVTISLSYSMFNFTEDQDLKVTVGYNAVAQKPYLRIRENNWSLNADSSGDWRVIYDL